MRKRGQSHAHGVLSLGVVALLLAAPTAAGADDGWRWDITPYMWFSDIGETLVVNDFETEGSVTEFDELVDLVDTSLQLRFEGAKDRWGMFADLTYIELSDSDTGEYGLLTTDVEIDETLLDLGAIYRPGGEDGRLELLFGARMYSVDESYAITAGERDPRVTEINEDYLDLLLAARYTLPLAERWALAFTGDLSLGDTDLVWTAQAAVGWSFGSSNQHAVVLGYRYREMDYEKADVVEVDKTISGAGLGVTFGF